MMKLKNRFKSDKEDVEQRMKRDLMMEFINNNMTRETKREMELEQREIERYNNEYGDVLNGYN